MYCRAPWQVQTFRRSLPPPSSETLMTVWNILLIHEHDRWMTVNVQPLLSAIWCRVMSTTHWCWHVPPKRPYLYQTTRHKAPDAVTFKYGAMKYQQLVSHDDLAMSTSKCSDSVDSRSPGFWPCPLFLIRTLTSMRTAPVFVLGWGWRHISVPRTQTVILSITAPRTALRFETNSRSPQPFTWQRRQTKLPKRPLLKERDKNTVILKKPRKIPRILYPSHSLILWCCDTVLSGKVKFTL